MPSPPTIPHPCSRVNGYRDHRTAHPACVRSSRCARAPSWRSRTCNSPSNRVTTNPRSPLVATISSSSTAPRRPRRPWAKSTLPVSGSDLRSGTVRDAEASPILATRVRAGDPLLAIDLLRCELWTDSHLHAQCRRRGDRRFRGWTLLFRTEVNDQPAVVLTVDPETSNLPKRVAFPVLIANMVAALASMVSQPRSRWRTAGLRTASIHNLGRDRRRPANLHCSGLP